MRTHVKFMVGNKSNIDSIVDNNINEATLQITISQKPKEMQTSTTFTGASGDFDYTIASGGDIAVTDLYAVEMVRNNTEAYRLHRGTLWEFENVDQTATGEQPSKWFHRGNVLYLYDPVPDASNDTFRVQYIKRPTALSADADTFGLNDEWIKPVEVMAAALTFADLNEFDKAAGKAQELAQLLQTRQIPEAMEDEMTPEAHLIFL
jgi:hypothetical protein